MLLLLGDSRASLRREVQIEGSLRHFSARCHVALRPWTSACLDDVRPRDPQHRRRGGTDAGAVGQFLLADGEGGGCLARRSSTRRSAISRPIRRCSRRPRRRPSSTCRSGTTWTMMVSDERIAQGKAALAQYARQPGAHRGALRRRPLHDRRRSGASRATTARCSTNPKLVKSTIRSLATLAYSGGRLAKFGRQQLVAALKIVQRGDVSVRRHDRLVGRRHGPDPVHPDDLRGLCRRLRR